MDSIEQTAIPFDHHKAEAARLRREAMATMFARIGRLWRRPARQTARNYGVGSGLATGQ